MNIDRILQSIDKIPAFPATVQRVSEVMKDEDYSVSDLVGVIEYDQAITANILRVSNSVYFGARRKIASLREALVYIGRENIIRIVNTAGISSFYRDVEGYALEGTRLWEHSVGVAMMSRIPAEKIYGREDPRLFTAGLIHDIGKIILGEYVNEAFQDVMDLVSNDGYSFLEAEEEVLGINHAEVGGRIASLWNFPRGIVDAITYHHRPDFMKDGDNTNAWLIYLADQACMIMGIGGGGADDLAYRGLEEVMDKFNICHRDFEKMIIQLFGELEKAKELVNLVEKR
jgi:putative nucleotidyltransferase with HDIG domain